MIVMQYLKLEKIIRVLRTFKIHQYTKEHKNENRELKFLNLTIASTEKNS